MPTEISKRELERVIRSAAHPNFRKVPIFFLGSFDARVTFYSQQVRALNLAYALKAGGYLDDWLATTISAAGDN